MVLAFAVKFPLFGLHYWLPIAHVEASTVGSILLAGVLLKAGCLGLFYVVSYLRFIVKFHWVLLGVILSILTILTLSDLKIIIAYSSVAHMSLVFYVLITGVQVGKIGALIIIFYHGFLSPVIFWLVGLLAWWKTRSLLVVKFLSFSPLIVYIIFIVCILNIGFPPFIGFLREILILKRLVTTPLTLTLGLVTVLFSCLYNIYFYVTFLGVGGTNFKVSFAGVETFIFILLSLVVVL
jgi:NADH:ubiquinone oxidoreductase subunit 4 (subunit M)